MGKWKDIPLNRKLFKNVGEDMLSLAYAELQNCFVTEAGGLSRFPGYKEFADLDGEAPVYMSKHRNDMICVGGDGAVSRIDRNGNIEKIDGVPVLGGHRAIFGRESDYMTIAAGDQIIKFDGKKTTVLSKNAPLTTHVGIIDGYVVAIEKDSGRFHHSNASEPETWEALNVFSVNGRGDDLNALFINPFNELLMTGEESIEQFERYGGANVPFFRRWSVADGISEPYTLCYSSNYVWGLNDDFEFVSIGGQTSTDVSQDINKDIQKKYSLNHLDSFNKAWATELKIKGQKFILFQSPEATNDYGGKGVTYVFDIRQNKWFQIYGWDNEKGVPALWGGRSICRMWGKTYVGGDGKVFELTEDVYENDGDVQRVYARTAKFSESTPIRINRVRVTLKRGLGDYEEEPQLIMRTNKDNKGFGKQQRLMLGKRGEDGMVLELGAQGTADVWQFEFMATDNCPIEIKSLKINITGLQR